MPALTNATATNQIAGLIELSSAKTEGPVPQKLTVVGRQRRQGPGGAGYQRRRTGRNRGEVLAARV